ncbi:MAG: glycosyltransferase [Burkholderiales bacterium]|jgi:glycosyltransferase involved in cell wall biosynthesis|nr:glycosyltransferase [Burkholderiales bacterium]
MEIIKYILLRLKRKLKLMLFNNRIDRDSIVLPASGKAYLNIWGYLNYIFGISITTRDFIYILSGKFKEFTLIPLQMTTKVQVKDLELSTLGQIGYPHPMSRTNLLFVNVDCMVDFYKKNKKYLRGRYNIAVYWWEFPDYLTFPGIFDNIDEVLVFSSVCYNAMRKVKPQNVKLSRLTYPFILKELKKSVKQSRAEFGLEEDDFIIMYIFDIHSSIERKNPYGVIDAFIMASRDIPNAKLVLKITNFELWRKECLELQNYIDSLQRADKFRIMTNNLSDDGVRNLINCCDVYLSLHRAEGFGISMLEAMSMGKAVVATNYGGNLDFMKHEQNGVLVSYKEVEVQKDFGPYKKGWLWADPDIKEAADALVKLANDKSYYKVITDMAREDTHRQYNLTKLQQEFAQYIQTISH